MAFEFGPKPEKLKVNLADDADFTLALEIPATDDNGTPLPPWPVDCELQFRFILTSGDPIIWSAEIDPDNERIMAWNIDKEVTAVLLAEFRAGRVRAARWFFDDDYRGKGEVQDVT